MLDKLRRLLNPTGQPSLEQRSYWINTRCRRCGEELSTRVDLLNDLSIDYETGHYHARKVLIGGENRCFEKVEVTLTFDKDKKLIAREIIGGEFIDQEE